MMQPSTTMIRILVFLNYSNSMKDVTGKDRGKWIYSMRIDAAERFAFSFMYGNTQFCTKTQSIFRTKKADPSFLVRLHWSIQNSSCTFNVPMFLTDVGQSKLILHSLLSSFLVVPGGKRGLQTPDPHTKSRDAMCMPYSWIIFNSIFFIFLIFTEYKGHWSILHNNYCWCRI